VLDTSFGDLWEPPADATALNIVSWKHGVDTRVEDGVDKRGFNGKEAFPSRTAAESCSRFYTRPLRHIKRQQLTP
jgi:hypothetical protein